MEGNVNDDDVEEEEEEEAEEENGVGKKGGGGGRDEGEVDAPVISLKCTWVQPLRSAAIAVMRALPRQK
ncbi:hypothetical protein KPH14_010822 [Odynerus spinipes]|uniref:Uncharacterized protein n=1 Tax=Odynerus spinipes TaxID=1348599 RepID=A0AAD9RHS7_9HYME|nr:hypothetical protein KPH14_010822 [Odynerus spinipes]